jgi:alkaline phosphatase D
MIRRRQFLASSLWSAGLAVAPFPALARRIEFPRDPFAFGVASGYPTRHGMTLWTRLALDPLVRGASLGVQDIRLEWEIASTPMFSRIVRRGEARAEARWGHSVHVDVQDLPAGREWFYRFRIGRFSSTTGRAWTAPTREPEAPLRIGMMSCQHYEQGYYHAYRHLTEAGVDLVLHLGDYLYEGNTAQPVRRHDLGECRSLEDYRLRYAWYRSDSQLQAAHEACPWLVTHDDHEVDNDYAAEQAENPDEQSGFLARRAAAYQAYYEFMPLPRAARPRGASMQLYRTAELGDLLSIHLLDTRQYRSAQPCPTPPKRGGSRVYVDQCVDWFDPNRSMLGSDQERWLDRSLRDSRARWNWLAQGVVFTRIDEDPGPRTLHWTDSWAGYPVARERLLDLIEGRSVRNPVILGGDIHAFIAADQRRETSSGPSPIVASELVTTSVSSGPPPQKVIDAYNRPDNRDVALADGSHRGYLRLEVGSQRLEAQMICFDSVRTPSAEARVLARFAIEDGRRGLQRLA